MKLATKFEKILREGARYAAPIEEIRDRLMDAIVKDHEKEYLCETCMEDFTKYHKGRSWE